MKRNTALKWIGWLGTLTVASLTFYDWLKHEVRAGVAYYEYDFTLPATELELRQFMQTHPDARVLSSLIVFGILAVFAILVGAIIVGLFGEPKADKPVTPK